MKPALRPKRPHFSSGPCPKPPSWGPERLRAALVGRSHRAEAGQARLARALELSRELLRLPESHRIAIVPGSGTGAFEMALWSLLGARGVDILVWESFSSMWAADVRDHLGIDDLRVLEAGYGELPDLALVSPDRDVVFPWVGTASGVMVPDGDWIAEDRSALTLCDATSGAFAMELPWDKLDVATYSWQKCLGGEAGHGMLILSPRAIRRLETHRPRWPIPKLFRMTAQGGLDEALFSGFTINTPSMLCVEDYLASLEWAIGLGGLDALVARCRRNFEIIAKWVAATDWVEFLAREPSQRAPTSVCLEISAPRFRALAESERREAIREMTGLLEREGVAFDVGSYRKAPAGLRIWAGPTVDADDVEALLPWLEWAFTRLVS